MNDIVWSFCFYFSSLVLQFSDETIVIQYNRCNGKSIGLGDISCSITIVKLIAINERARVVNKQKFKQSEQTTNLIPFQITHSNEHFDILQHVFVHMIWGFIENNPWIKKNVFCVPFLFATVGFFARAIINLYSTLFLFCFCFVSLKIIPHIRYRIILDDIQYI